MPPSFRYYQQNMAPVVPSKQGGANETSNNVTSHPPSTPYPTPLLRLKFNDLSHPGADDTLAALHPIRSSLKFAVDTVLSLLYPLSSNTDGLQWPGTRSITLVLADEKGGVAYTAGKAIDDDHKEITVSLDYLSGHVPRDRLQAELKGVLVHEMVHCWQYNAGGSAPGGLVEGIADWVRLRAGLRPPHWRRDGEGQWDRGYQHTGYFLDWIERRFGRHSVPRINHELRQRTYEEHVFWPKLFGKSIEELWKAYVHELRHGEEEREGEVVAAERSPNASPTSKD